MNDYRWSLGTLLWLPAAGVLLIVGVVLAFLMFRAWRTERAEGGSYSDAPLFLGSAIACVVAILLLIGGTAWGMWPYSGEYHQWRTESGTVTAVDSRLITSGDDNGPTQRFVVTLDGDRQRSCDDTRCAQVEVGDDLTLSCKRAWQWSGTHGYDCNFVSRERGTR